MKRLIILLVLAAAALASSRSIAAQDRGPWRAASSTARAITGDIAISDTKLFINFAPFSIASIRTLTQTETSATFSAAVGGEIATLYRLDIPARRQFQHKNTLCGSDDTQWMVTAIIGKTLQVAFFSGTQMPIFTFDGLKDSTEVCGTFTYVR